MLYMYSRYIIHTNNEEFHPFSAWLFETFKKDCSIYLLQ